MLWIISLKLFWHFFLVLSFLFLLFSQNLILFENALDNVNANFIFSRQSTSKQFNKWNLNEQNFIHGAWFYLILSFRFFYKLTALLSGWMDRIAIVLSLAFVENCKMFVVSLSFKWWQEGVILVHFGFSWF